MERKIDFKGMVKEPIQTDLDGWMEIPCAAGVEKVRAPWWSKAEARAHGE